MGLSLCTAPLGNAYVASAGITKSATTNDAARPKTILKAIGWKSFPSTPSRLKSGANTTIMISTAKNTGCATSRAASWMRSR